MLNSISDAKPLSGVLPPMIEKSVYLVTGDIFVSPGSSVTVAAGTIFLFREFTGIHVQGVLYVNGTDAEQVIFTSVNDSAYVTNTTVKAAPYDWNGIDIYDGAPGTTISFCRIQYSVYGIRSQTEYVKLDNLHFSNNGKSDFTIKSERKEVTDPFSYSFEYKSVAVDTPVVAQTVSENTFDKSVKTQKPSLGADPTIQKKRGNRGARVFFRLTGLALTLGGGALTAYYGNEYLKAQDHLKDISIRNEVNLRTYTSKDWDAAKNDRDQKLVNASIFGGVAVLGLTSFFISFAF
jgi:hypothetical protein